MADPHPSPSPSPNPNPNPNPDLVLRAGDVLVELLARQSAMHEQLVAHLEAKRAAIRTADVESMTRICEAERALALEIEAIEMRRRDVVRDLTAVLEPGRDEPFGLAEVAERLPGDAGTRLTELRGTLRATLEEAVRLSAIVTAASEAVGRHLAGLVNTLGSAIAPPVTYGRAGRMTPAVHASGGLDLRS